MSTGINPINEKSASEILTPSQEAAIIPLINEGQTALFEVLIRRYNPLLYKVARSYGFNHQDAEDLMQEAYVTAYLKLKQLQQPESFKWWLLRILSHKCLYKLNSSPYQKEKPTDEITQTPLQPMFTAKGNLNAEKQVINHELSKVLENALQQIPVPYRTVFVLREVEAFTVAETAEILNISPVNVKVRLNRAKTLLQKELEKFYAAADIYEFHLSCCDRVVQRFFDWLQKINKRFNGLWFMVYGLWLVVIKLDGLHALSAINEKAAFIN